MITGERVRIIGDVEDMKRWAEDGGTVFHERRGEKVGGGFLVFRRGKLSRRIYLSAKPFEHPNLDAAIEEAKKLSRKNPGEEFDVFRKVTSFKA